MLPLSPHFFELNKGCRILDPFGVLGPEEVQIKSSKRNLRTDDGLLTDIILGDVLVCIPCLNNPQLF